MAIPTHAPTSFFSGDTVLWTQAPALYLPSAGWTLVADLANANHHYALNSVDHGDGTHLFNFSAAETSAFVAGEYRLGIAATNAAGERFTLFSADIVIKASLASTGDARSQIKKDLDALNAWITSGDPKVAEYTIAGRSMKYHDPMMLEDLRNIRKREYRAEQNAERRAAGFKPRRRLLTRMRA